jgi:hypothetical protein
MSFFMKQFLLGGFLLLGSLNAGAQFTSAVYNDVPYPSGNPVQRPDDIHCYSAEVSMSGNTYTLNVYGWNNAGTSAEGFAWRLMSGSSLVNAGIVPVNNSSSIDMGIVQEPNTGTIKVVVAYHKTGVGHFMDIYDAAVTGLTLVSSMNLSNANALPRISVDAHKLYGVLISWSDPNQGIFVKTLNTNTGLLTIGTTHILTNTFKSLDPDITFTHSGSNPLLAHVAFHRGSPNQMEEQRMDFFAMHGSMSIPFTGAVEDVYPIPSGWDVGPASIDGPEHASVENWAYAFPLFNPSTGFGPVITRVKNGTTSTVSQFDATEGPFGSTPTGPYDLSTRLNRGVSLAFDPIQDYFRIAWFYCPTTNYSAGRYVVQYMKINGGLLNPGGTYLNAEVNPAGNTSGTRCITLNPNNSTPENFTAYGHFNGSVYSIRVKSLPWAATSFKTAPTAVTGAQSVSPDFNIYPNPSSSAPSISFSGTLADAELNAVIVNSFGQVCAAAHGDGQTLGMRLIENWSSLPAGQYIVRVYSPELGYAGTKTITKL